MKITIDRPLPAPIAGVADEAMVRIDGDEAEATAYTAALKTRRRLLGTEVEMLGGKWLVTGASIAGALTSFTFRRIDDGR